MGPVLDVLDHDLAVLVEGQVGRSVHGVPEETQGRPGAPKQALELALLEEPADLVAEHVAAVCQALQVALERQRSQQVIGGAHRQAHLARQLLRVSTLGNAGCGLQQAQPPLD
jgi:hypothetical protein